MLSQDYIAKIEGHGKIDINFENNKAKLIIDEGERLFEGLVLGRPYHEVPFIVSRICGICPTSHYLSSLKALESAFKVKPNETSIDLRKILLLGQISQSHILHVIFLALPDYLKVDNITEIASIAPSEFATALKIKNISDKIVEIIGGRPIHPVTPTIGGFTKYPKKDDLISLRNDVENVMKDLVNLTRFISNQKYPSLRRETEYLGLNSDSEYALYDGMIYSNTGYAFDVKNYKKEITEIIKSYSSAKFGKRNEHGFMVGALARISNHANKLNPLAKRELDAFYANKTFPSYNSFHNNFAQMIEIVHSYEEIIALINKVIKNGLGESKSLYKVTSGKGYGAVEAPRGTLYHYYEIDKYGIVTDCDIITPTVQNLTNIEEDVHQLLLDTKHLSSNKREHLINMLIRAYDPCITCSVH